MHVHNARALSSLSVSVHDVFYHYWYTVRQPPDKTQCIAISSNCTCIRLEGSGKSVRNLTWDSSVSHASFILLVSPERCQATTYVADPKVVQQVTIKQFSHFREVFMPIIDNPLLSGAASEGAKSMMIVAKYASCSASVLQH